MTLSHTRDYSLGPEISDDGEPYFALRHAIDCVTLSGVAVEFGVGSGTSTRLLANRMPVIGFDSGKGLPEDWRPEYPRRSLQFDIPVVENATIVPGWFADTLPEFDFGPYHIGLVHFDADLFSSTWTALAHIGPYLKPGCILVFDEWFGYDGAEEHEQRAWRGFVDVTGVDWEVIGRGHQEWVIRITGGWI